ncbi:MAG: YeeE/YedE family protein [Chloroflexi bacterium]|nr:YeeE/YedE family protein [Chloroflexota bacterium]
MNTFLNYFRKSEWSPYLAGVALGLVSLISLAATGKLLGASGGWENLAGYFGLLIDPNNMYFKFVMPPGIGFNVWLLVGVFFGGMAGALLANEWKIHWMPDKQWIEVFGPSRPKRFLIVFLSTALLEIAAGIAGGCTSGLAISGGIVAAPAAFLFIASMFATGILTAWLAYGKRY